MAWVAYLQMLRQFAKSKRKRQRDEEMVERWRDIIKMIIVDM
jgi:hypothetical protein